MPDVSTEIAIATTTLGSAASSITFSSIPSTYTDLRISFTFQTSASIVGLRFNSDSANNYSFTYLDADGSTARSGATANSNYIATITNGTPPSSTNYTFSTIDIFSYAGSTNKTVLITNSNDKNGSGSVSRIVGLWRSTSAITSITLVDRLGGNDLNTGTTATIYGIL